MVTDEPIEVAQYNDQSSLHSQRKNGSQESGEVDISYDLDSLLRSLDASSTCTMDDIEVLQVHLIYYQRNDAHFSMSSIFFPRVSVTVLKFRYDLTI